MSNIRCFEGHKSIKHCHADMGKRNCDHNNIRLKCTSKTLRFAFARICIIMGVRFSYHVIHDSLSHIVKGSKCKVPEL